MCVVDNKGKVYLERELPCEVEDVADCLAAFAHPIERVGFEAGAMSQHSFFGLQSKGFEVVCMEARQVSAALSAMRNKTDKTGSQARLIPPSKEPPRLRAALGFPQVSTRGPLSFSRRRYRSRARLRDVQRPRLLDD